MKRQRGFTLVELMIVVVVLGVLAAIAIPTFIKYVKNSKTSEAKENLAYLFRSSVTYFAQERVDKTNPYSADPGRQFPVSEGPNPSSPPRATKTTVTWDAPTWQALKFAIADPHYYSYQYVSSGSGTTASFTAIAYGDLDGDTVLSTFERMGKSTAQLEVMGSGGLVIIQALE